MNFSELSFPGPDGRSNGSPAGPGNLKKPAGISGYSLRRFFRFWYLKLLRIRESPHSVAVPGSIRGLFAHHPSADSYRPDFGLFLQMQQNRRCNRHLDNQPPVCPVRVLRNVSPGQGCHARGKKIIRARGSDLCKYRQPGVGFLFAHVCRGDASRSGPGLFDLPGQCAHGLFVSKKKIPAHAA